MQAHQIIRTLHRLAFAFCLAAPMITAPLYAQQDFEVPGPLAAPAKPLEKSPFWKSKPLKLPALKKGEVKLLETPNEEIDFAIIQVGEGKTKYVGPYLEEAEIPYALSKEPLKVGSKVYSDRKYVITELPESLKGLSHLQTSANHKAVVDARYAILLETEKPIWVFLAIDDRAITNYTALSTPAWLKEYTPTEYKITTDDPLMAETKSNFQIYARKVPPGKFTLGPAALEVRGSSMYFAFFGEDK